MNLIYKLAFGIGAVIFLVSNVYFGWNTTAQSGAERVFDLLAGGFLYYGFIGMVAHQAACAVRDEVLDELKEKTMGLMKTLEDAVAKRKAAPTEEKNSGETA